MSLLSIEFPRDVYFSRIICNFELRDEVSNVRGSCLAKRAKAMPNMFKHDTTNPAAYRASRKTRWVTPGIQPAILWEHLDPPTDTSTAL